MAGLEFSVPYNNKFETLEKIVENFGNGVNGNKVSEVYMSGPREYFGSGRAVPPVTLKELVKAIDFCHENNLNVNLALNSTCGGSDWYQSENIDKVIRYVKNLHEKHGLKSVIIANPLFIQRIRKEFPKLQIIASVLGEIASVQRAMFYKKLGADIITPDRDINRDLEKLKEIKEATDLELCLLVNEGCLFRCPYRIFHFNLISHASDRFENNVVDFPHHNCSRIVKIDTSQVLKSSWIRPEDISKYKDITSSFKIAGRLKPTPWIINVIKAYLNESYEGNLLDLLDGASGNFRGIFNAFIDNKSLDGFFEKVRTCDKNCYKCHYCEELAKKVVKFNPSHEDS